MGVGTRRAHCDAFGSDDGSIESPLTIMRIFTVGNSTMTDCLLVQIDGRMYANFSCTIVELWLFADRVHYDMIHTRMRRYIHE